MANSVKESWASKAPADMTLEELQSAKNGVQRDLDSLQQEVAWRSSANTALSTEILRRFSMETTPGFISPEALPHYPAEQIAVAYGGALPPAPQDQ